MYFPTFWFHKSISIIYIPSPDIQLSYVSLQ